MGLHPHGIGGRAAQRASLALGTEHDILTCQELKLSSECETLLRKNDAHDFPSWQTKGFGSFGRRREKVVPFPNSLSTEIDPKWASTML